MIMQLKLWFIPVFLILTACNQTRKPKFAQQPQLEHYLSQKSISTKKPTLLLILQRELCSCTADDTELSYQLLTSPKYKAYNRVLIVTSDEHSIISKLKKSGTLGQIRLISNAEQEMRKNNLVFAVNRFLIFQDEEMVQNFDLHLASHSMLRSKYL
jgi:hypothetical protein